ncbi:MAG TPA: DUF2148 domain-containing protein [Bacteroidales bacterium]|nr:DUF2148 domain-containing protein [Bacteroidales bacterium]
MISETEFKTQEIIGIAKRMAIAVRTAPKGRGRNTIETRIAHGEDLITIAAKMEELGKSNGQNFFIRDAGNVRNSDAVLFIATEISPLGLKDCGFCGLQNCDKKLLQADVPCSFNTIDLGIAIGSAVSIAADARLDNRIMFSAGRAVKELKYFEDKNKIIIAISLSASSKNIYFDRQ